MLFLSCSRCTRRCFSSASTSTSTSTRRAARRHLIFGTNTDVGKTVITTGLLRSPALASGSKRAPTQQHYIKPLQCGGSDEAFIQKYTNTTARSSNIITQETLFAWKSPASPHVASIRENLPVSDQQVLDALKRALLQKTSSPLDGGSGSNRTATTVWIETAGGCLSPSSASPHNASTAHAKVKVRGARRTTGSNSSSTAAVNATAQSTTTEADDDEDDDTYWGWKPQADVYQPLLHNACSVILIGDGKLGGIGATLATMEALVSSHRNYHVAGIILLEQQQRHQDEYYPHDNASALTQYYHTAAVPTSASHPSERPRLPPTILSLPPLPTDETIPLYDWYNETEEAFATFNAHLQEDWDQHFAERDASNYF